MRRISRWRLGLSSVRGKSYAEYDELGVLEAEYVFLCFTSPTPLVILLTRHT